MTDAREYAIKAHGEQTYGNEPYSYHLNQVVAVLSQYTDNQYLINAAWLHDVIEDTKIDYFELTRIFGSPVANIVWACTGVGNDRKARQASILSKLGVFPGAPMVKLADRIANVSANLAENREEKFNMYAKEHLLFASAVSPYVPAEMLEEYNKLIYEGYNRWGYTHHGKVETQ